MRVTGGKLAEHEKLTNYHYTRKGGYSPLRADGALYSGGRNTRYAKSWHAPRVKVAPAYAVESHKVACAVDKFHAPTNFCTEKAHAVRYMKKGVRVTKKA